MCPADWVFVAYSSVASKPLSACEVRLIRGTCTKMVCGFTVLSWPGPVTPGPLGLPTWTYWANGEAEPRVSTLCTMAT